MTIETFEALKAYLEPQKNDPYETVARNAERWCAQNHVDFHPIGCDLTFSDDGRCKHLNPSDAQAKRAAFDALVAVAAPPVAEEASADDPAAAPEAEDATTDESTAKPRRKK